MTYTSASGPATGAQAKLASRRWRLVNSLWIVLPILSFGALGWLGFLIAAIRTGRRLYWICTATYAALFAVFLVLMSVDPGGVGEDIAMVPFLAAWIAATIHAAMLNRGYLRELAATGEWYAAPVPPPDAGRSGPPHTVLGVSHSDYYGPGAAPPAPAPQHAPHGIAPGPPDDGRPLPHADPTGAEGTVDVNTATREALGALPGVDDALARRIVAVRDARGGYRDIDDLVLAANLQPHELVRIRDRVTVGSPGGARRERPGHDEPGRILDI